MKTSLTVLSALTLLILGTWQATMAEIANAPMVKTVRAVTSLPHLSRRQIEDTIGNDYSRAIVNDARAQLEEKLAQRNYHEVIQIIRENYMDVLLFCGTAFELKAHMATLTTLARTAGNESEFEININQLVVALKAALNDAEQQHFSCPAVYLRSVVKVVESAQE